MLIRANSKKSYPILITLFIVAAVLISLSCILSNSFSEGVQSNPSKGVMVQIASASSEVDQGIPEEANECPEGNKGTPPNCIPLQILPSLTASPTPIPARTPTPIVITNINNNQVTVRNDGGFTVQSYAGAVITTPDCPPQSATVLLGQSTMEIGGARILAAFEPCILTDGTVILNIPDGIQLVAANIAGGQTTQSAIVPK